MRANANSLRNAQDLDPLSCTFEQAEERNLIANINSSTRAKVEFFEEMIEIGFKFGALKPNGPITFEALALENAALDTALLRARLAIEVPKLAV